MEHSLKKELKMFVNEKDEFSFRYVTLNNEGNLIDIGPITKLDDYKKYIDIVMFLRDVQKSLKTGIFIEKDIDFTKYESTK